MRLHFFKLRQLRAFLFCFAKIESLRICSQPSQPPGAKLTTAKKFDGTKNGKICRIPYAPGVTSNKSSPTPVLPGFRTTAGNVSVPESPVPPHEMIRPPRPGLALLALFPGMCPPEISGQNATRIAPGAARTRNGVPPVALPILTPCAEANRDSNSPNHFSPIFPSPSCTPRVFHVRPNRSFSFADLARRLIKKRIRVMGSLEELQARLTGFEDPRPMSKKKTRSSASSFHQNGR